MYVTVTVTVKTTETISTVDRVRPGVIGKRNNYRRDVLFDLLTVVISYESRVSRPTIIVKTVIIYDSRRLRTTREIVK